MNELAVEWGEWLDLRGSPKDKRVPSLPGLYRIRRLGRADLDYIGQTGSGKMTLRKRLRMLSGVYGAEMPYRDPHTAGPGLWALHHSTKCDFEVSVALVHGNTPWRQGLEALSIAMYRQQWGRSPTINFGNLPTGYKMSSGNTAKLARAGKRFRGGFMDEGGYVARTSISPMGSLVGNVQGQAWCGHEWSDWVALREFGKGRYLGNGLYRLRGEGTQGELLYVGQGRIRSRLIQHLATARNGEREQGRVFARAGTIECSWVLSEDWEAHQRLEIENDLIASHMLNIGRPPAGQFMIESIEYQRHMLGY